MNGKYRESQKNFEISQEIFGKLTETELELLESKMDSAAHQASKARNRLGNFVWDGLSFTEFSQLAGTIRAFRDFIPE